MRTFEYKGFNHAGQVARGLIEALDIKDAREKLSHQGVLAESVLAAGSTSRWVWRRRDVIFTLDTRAAFYRELASILAAGVPLSQALTLLMDAPEMGDNRSVIAGIRDRIAEGKSMADAVADASSRVTPFEQALIETGERSGRLDDVLNRIADFLETERGLRDRLISAMIYPAVILMLSLLVGWGMLWFMLPAFRDLLLESGVELPWITQSMLAVGSLAGYLLPLFIVALVVTVALIKGRLHQDEAFRIAMNRHLHNMLLVRSFYGVLVNVRFTRTWAMLLQSGVPLLESLSQAARASGSPWLIALIEHEISAIRQGGAIADAISRVPPLAATLPGWIRAGEASGDLAGMLDHAATRSQQTWERRVTRTMTLIESTLVIVVGLCVFILALSIILPILSLNQVLQ